jgi:hypothetical protein
MKKSIIFFSLSLFISVQTSAQLTIKKIKPSTTDATIATFDADSNFVYLNQGIPAKNLLLIHLPGTFGEPKRATLFGSLAANLGFHSIGLMYPNVPTVGSFCTNNTDLTCFENVRREIIEGLDYSPEISIQQNEAIYNRIKKLLSYLSTNYPSENWSQYLNESGEVNWEKVIVSGHSQGGGHAALMGKLFPLKRVLCFSSPKDWNNTIDNVPPWVGSENWAMDKSNVFVFNHLLDEHEQQLVIWDSLGLNSSGPSVNVETMNPPYSNTRQLVTNYNVNTGDEHASTIQDNKTPKVNLIPVFEPVWTYMLTFDLLAELPTNKSDKFVISPNPTNDFIYIPSDFMNSTISIVDISGKELLQSFNTEKIDVSNLKNGYYYLVIDRIYTYKILKN